MNEPEIENQKAKASSRNWIIGLFCAFPIILFLEFYSFSFFMEKLREKSDTSVLIGVVSIAAFLFFNFLLIKLIVTKTKNP